MSVYEAVQADLPFFAVEEQIDNRREGGDFDNVKFGQQDGRDKGDYFRTLLGF